MNTAKRILGIKRELIQESVKDLIPMLKKKKIHRIYQQENRLIFVFPGDLDDGTRSLEDKIVADNGMRPMEFDSYEEAKEIGELISSRLKVPFEVY